MLRILFEGEYNLRAKSIRGNMVVLVYCLERKQVRRGGIRFGGICPPSLYDTFDYCNIPVTE